MLCAAPNALPRPACCMPTKLFTAGEFPALLRLLFAQTVALIAAAAAASPSVAQNISLQWLSASRDVQFALSDVIETQNNRGLPFAIVDKKGAQLFVFNGAGLLQGAAPALLGLTPGDTELALPAGTTNASLTPARRTTPAGRFVSEPGRNLSGEAIVWVDYAARLAIHRLRPAPAHERRAERLASSSPDDNRITLGCVVVEPQFYDAVVAPVLGKGYGVVYVLPENDALKQLHAVAH